MLGLQQRLHPTWLLWDDNSTTHMGFRLHFSSLEHSGLGRYGDALNPWGDVEAAVQTWCLLKPGGIFFMGLPCKDASCSEDVLVWNAHR
jgi:hypothetical protein